MNKDLLVMICGSYRRGRDKSGDVDCLIAHPLIKTKDETVVSVARIAHTVRKEVDDAETGEDVDGEVNATDLSENN